MFVLCVVHFTFYGVTLRGATASSCQGDDGGGCSFSC